MIQLDTNLWTNIKLTGLILSLPEWLCKRNVFLGNSEPRLEMCFWQSRVSLHDVKKSQESCFTSIPVSLNVQKYFRCDSTNISGVIYYYCMCVCVWHKSSMFLPSLRWFVTRMALKATALCILRLRRQPNEPLRKWMACCSMTAKCKWMYKLIWKQFGPH